MNRKRRHSIGTQTSYVHFNEELGVHSWKEKDHFSELNCDKEIFCYCSDLKYKPVIKVYERNGKKDTFYIGVWQWLRPINIACRVGNMKLLKKVCHYGATLNSLNVADDNPLTKAVFNKHIDAVEYLLKLGADVNFNDKKVETPLITACTFFREKEKVIPMVDLLLDYGAEIDKPFYYSNEDTALSAVIEYTNIELAEHLINRGADCTSINYKGEDLMDRFIFWVFMDKKVHKDNKYSHEQLSSFMQKLKENGVKTTDSEINFKVSVLTSNESVGCCGICFREKELKIILPCVHKCFCHDCTLIVKRSQRCAMCRSPITYVV